MAKNEEIPPFYDIRSFSLATKKLWDLVPMVHLLNDVLVFKPDESANGTSVKSTRDLEPLVQSKILSAHGQKLEKNLTKNTKVCMCVDYTVVSNKSTRSSETQEVQIRT